MSDMKRAYEQADYLLSPSHENENAADPEARRRRIMAAITTEIRRERLICAKIADQIHNGAYVVIANRHSDAIGLDGEPMSAVSARVEQEHDR